jgi:hypothetical protein
VKQGVHGLKARGFSHGRAFFRSDYVKVRESIIALADDP